MTYEQFKEACLVRMFEKGWDCRIAGDFFEWLLPVEFKDRYEAQLAESDELVRRVMDVIG
jgi:hypothetical protein